MHRVLFVSLLTAAVLGCDGSSTTNPLPGSLLGSFAMMESAVADLNNTINSPTYRPVPDLGTDQDHMGTALETFEKNSAGTRLAGDAAEIRKKWSALETLAKSRAPVAKQREAVKDLQATVAATRAKL